MKLKYRANVVVESKQPLGSSVHTAVTSYIARLIEVVTAMLYSWHKENCAI